MAQSAQAKEVILEIGEKDAGLSTITSYVQNGSISHDIFNQGCDGGCDVYNIISPLNANEEFDNFNGWYGMRVTDFRIFGNTPNNPTWINTTNPGTNIGFSNTLNYSFSATGSVMSSQIIKLSFLKSDGGNADFEGQLTSIWNSSPPTYVNNMKRDNRSNTEQGRMLYLYPTAASGFDASISFEILEGDGDDLFVRGPGCDNLGNFLQAKFPGTPINDFFETDFWTNFTGYITPYVHTAAWKYDVGSINYNSSRKSIHGSYVSDYADPVNYASVVNDDHNFGLRSSHPLFECRKFETQGYKIKFTIDAISNCEVEVLTYLDWTSTGSYVNVSGLNIGDIQYALDYEGVNLSERPWGWKTFSDPGTYEVCVPFIPDMVIYDELNHPVLGGTTGGWSTQVKVQYGGNAFGYKHFYNAQYHFLRVKDINTGTGVVHKMTMSKFEIYEGGMGFDKDILPTYQTNEIQVQTYTYDYLDTINKDSIPLGLTLNSGDLRDPSKRSTGYSKTFELPASVRNQRVLRTMTADGSNRLPEDLGWKKARISVNGIVCFNGFARIEQSVTGAGGKYKCHILQDPSYWPELLKDKKLCELGLPTHEKDYMTVIASWNKTVDQINYVYPIINYGEWTKDSDPSITAHSIKDLHPAIYVKSIVSKMFSDIGYTIESDFFDKPEFKKLIVPYSSGEQYDFSGSTGLGNNSDYSAHASKSGVVDLPTIPATGSNLNLTRYFYPVIPVQNGAAHYTQGSSGSVQNGYTVPFSGRYNIFYKATVKIRQNGTAGDSAVWASRIAVNGQTMGYSQYGGWADNATDGTQYVFNANVGPPTTQDGITPTDPVGLPNCVWRHYDNGEAWTTEQSNMVMNLSAGDKVQIRYFGINFKAFREAKCEVKSQDFQVYPVVGQAFVPPFTASPNMALGCGVKQLDFLKGITEMFNLYWDADNEQKKVFVEPYDDFYGSGNLVDWSHKLDKSSWSDKFLIDELAKSVFFRYKNDSSDKIVQAYNDSMSNALGYEKELWDFKIEHEELYRKSEKMLGSSIISPTMRMYTAGNGCDNTFPHIPFDNPPTIPCMWSGSPSWGWFNTLDRPALDTSYNIRILNYYGLSPNTGTWRLTDGNGVVQNVNNYPYAYTFNYEHACSATYDDNLAWHNNSVNGCMQRGLFDRYYGNFFEKVSGGAALRTCMMDLTPTDIATFNFRNIIKIVMDGGVSTYWTVNKVADYKPALDDLTKVELIEWKYEVPSNKGGQKAKLSIPPTNYGGLDVMNPDGGSSVIKEEDRTIILSTNGEYSIIDNKNIPTPNLLPTKNNVTIKSQLMQAPEVNQEALIVSKHNGITNQSANYSGGQANVINGNAIALGKGLRSHSGQIVLGCHNESNPNDIFQVGSGYDNKGERVLQNAISVDENGDFSVFGGEVVADFTVQDLTITGDVYYTDKDGTKKKMYLKTKPNSTQNNNKY